TSFPFLLRRVSKNGVDGGSSITLPSPPPRNLKPHFPKEVLFLTSLSRQPFLLLSHLSSNTRLIHSSSSRVATPNSVLSEEAFKSLGLSTTAQKKTMVKSSLSRNSACLSVSASLSREAWYHSPLPDSGFKRAVLVPALQGRDIKLVLRRELGRL
ncbi:hypothetical protein HID58_007913, partial [Brassica napus]